VLFILLLNLVTEDKDLSLLYSIFIKYIQYAYKARTSRTCRKFVNTLNRIYRQIVINSRTRFSRWNNR